MSNSSTPAPERDAQLLDIGRRCAHAHCGLVDFLPFTCQSCAQPFCGEHFLPAAHACAQYDERAHNRIAPPCPFCSTPVAIPPGQDPNIRMERHLSQECAVLTGKPAATKKQPVCGRPKCGKVLYAPISCDKCKHQFCPAHRFPSEHPCATAAAPATPAAAASQARANVSAGGAAALAAIRRQIANAQTSSASASTSASAGAKPSPGPARAKSKPAPAASASKPKLFNSADRRAKAERESRLKAMQERAKRGLLSEEEKAILAAELAERGGKSDKDCVVC